MTQKEQPRYRKSRPSSVRTFETHEEMEDFLDDQKAVGDSTFSVLKTFLHNSTSTSKFNDFQRSMIEKLLDKCDKFCPHIDTLVMPKVRHFILPQIRSCFCFDCAGPFMREAQTTAGNDCDSCGKHNKNFVEFSLPLGYGLMNFNLGTTCCASLLNGQKYDE